MGLRARMGGAGESDLRRAEAEVVGSARLDQRDRLQRLVAERGKMGAATSPTVATISPSARTTATAPACRLSTSAPRVNSMRTGFGMCSMPATPPTKATSLPNLSPRDLAREPRLRPCGKEPPSTQSDGLAF